MLSEINDVLGSFALRQKTMSLVELLKTLNKLSKWQLEAMLPFFENDDMMQDCIKKVIYLKEWKKKQTNENKGDTLPLFD